MTADEFNALLCTEEDIKEAVTAEPGIVAQAWQLDSGRRRRAPEWRWLEAFRVAGYPADLPTGPTLLYRGATQFTRLGMSWTPDYTVAATYAKHNGLHQPQCGNVYAHWAYSSEILARINHRTRDANQRCYDFEEYVLDYRYLSDDNVKPVAVGLSNYLHMVSQYDDHDWVLL